MYSTLNQYAYAYVYNHNLYYMYIITTTWSAVHERLTG